MNKQRRDALNKIISILEQLQTDLEKVKYDECVADEESPVAGVLIIAMDSIGEAIGHINEALE